MLNKEQISFYEERGYLIVDNVVSKSDLNLIKAGINIIIEIIVTILFIKVLLEEFA